MGCKPKVNNAVALSSDHLPSSHVGPGASIQEHLGMCAGGNCADNTAGSTSTMHPTAVADAAVPNKNSSGKPGC
jgi:hypothetical protein